MKRFNATPIEGLSAYQLSRTVARIRRFTGVDKAVLRALVDHYPNVWPNVETIAEESGWGLTAVRSALTIMAMENWICPVSATREDPTGRKGGKNQSEQYVINDRKILNTFTAQKFEDGMVSGKIPTHDTHRQTVSIHAGNPSPDELNPPRGEDTHRVASPNPPPDGEEVIREEIKEEKREERDQESPSALASLSTSKPKAAGRDKAEAKALVREIKKAALDASDGKAVFYAKNSQVIEQALIENPALTRHSLLPAVRTRVQEMGTDEFRLAHCGSEIAEMLAPLVEYKADVREAQARQDAQAQAILAGVAERHKRDEEELLAKRAEAEAETSMVGVDGQGLFS
jgi:hypothetical protein